MTTEQHAREVLTPAQIAAGLTKAQREAVKGAVSHCGQWRAFAMYPADKNLRSKGLTNGLFANLTPLGLSVRQHLLEQDAEGRR